jgi:glucose/mannose-6-phosphate isomerase
MTELSRETIAKVDKDGMLGRILTLGEQLERAWQEASSVSPKIDRVRIDNIVVAGMGGSAISGDIVRAVAAQESSVPLTVNRHYELPGYVGPKTLVVASSYSGNTEETLSAFDQARQKGAQVVAITSGGQLGQWAREEGYTVYPITIDSPPRAAIAFLTAPLLHLLSHLEQIRDPGTDVRATSRLLETLASSFAPEVAGEENLCKTLAKTLHQKLPLVYASVHPLEGVALRWKGQFSENSKVLAFANVFPELNHNEIVGWGLDKRLQERIQVVYLRDRGDHPRIQKRLEITREILTGETAPFVEVWSRGESLLERLFSLIFIGDLTSLYLAVLNEVDPTPVAKIDLLKQRLARA